MLAVGHYDAFVNPKLSFIYDKQSRKQYKTGHTSPKRSSLEEEIFLLRQAMENQAIKEQSLTSELVVRISRLLDQKINEYMKNNRK